MASIAQSRDGALTEVSVKKLTEPDRWPCGHERTGANTMSVGISGVRCRTCRNAIAKKSYHNRKHDISAEERSRINRIYYLPGQLLNTKRKLARLEAEAIELGMADILEISL